MFVNFSTWRNPPGNFPHTHPLSVLSACDFPQSGTHLVAAENDSSDLSFHPRIVAIKDFK